MPSHRRSSRLQLTERRCSLQSLSVDLDDDEQPRRSARTPPKQQPQQQQPRRSKRIQELNAKQKQSSSLIISQSHCQPSSPVSVVTSINDNNLTTDDDLVPKMASLSIITPIKPSPPSSRGVVRFGNNSVARFSGCDPPMFMERLSPNASRLILPRDSDNNHEDDEELELDDETKWNCHILAQWDDSFEDEEDELDQDDFEESSLLDEEESVEMPCHDASLWNDATTTASRVIVEEEEDFIFNNDDGNSSSLTSCWNGSNDRPKNHHPAAAALSSSRPIKRVDEYFCKSCGHGMRRTSRYVYEED